MSAVRRIKRVDALCSLLHIEHPILLAPMVGVCTPLLAAEVSQGGGLGALGFGAILNSDLDDKANQTKGIAQVNETNRIFSELTHKGAQKGNNSSSLSTAQCQLGFFAHRPVSEVDKRLEENWIQYCQPLFDKYASSSFSLKTPLRAPYASFLESDIGLDIILNSKPRAASFHFGLPHRYQLEQIKAAGVVTMATATSITEAIQIAECLAPTAKTTSSAKSGGIDIIVAQGIEAGGHRGTFDDSQPDPCVATIDLVRQISSHPKTAHIPIVAAGGIMNGAEAAKMIAAGASGVQMGTAFVQCPSSAANEEYKKRLFSKDATTQITASVSGRSARGLHNLWATLVDVPPSDSSSALLYQNNFLRKPKVPPYPVAYHLGKQLHEAATTGPKREHGFGAHWAGANVRGIRKMDASELIRVVAEELDQALRADK